MGCCTVRIEGMAHTRQDEGQLAVHNRWAGM